MRTRIGYSPRDNSRGRPTCGLPSRTQPGALALITVAACAAGMASASDSTASASNQVGRQPAAHAAHVLNVRDEGRLRYIKSSGSLIIDEGRAAGTFPGLVKVHFTYDGEPTVSAQFTISGSNGSISAHARARLSSPTSPSPSFHGAMVITGGTGLYAHVHGGGELYGVYYRHSYGLTVQAIGKLPY